MSRTFLRGILDCLLSKLASWGKSSSCGLPKNLDSWIMVLNTHIETYFRYTLQYPSLTKEVKKRYRNPIVKLDSTTQVALLWRRYYLLEIRDL